MTVPNLSPSFLSSKPSGYQAKIKAKSFDQHEETSISHGMLSVTPEGQIILQTLMDVWMVVAGTVIIASFIQIYHDFKGLK